jgi:hypothetical protein
MGKPAKPDPLWAIVLDEDEKHNKWDVDEFLATGETEIAAVMAKANTLGYPEQRDTVLDPGLFSIPMNSSPPG